MPRNDDDEIVRRIKVDSPTFDGAHDPMIFSDWLADIDYYFNWYKISKECKVQLARMRLTWSNKVYWSSVERSCVRNRVLIETWDEMKDNQEKYFPESNSHRLLDELHRLRQGSMSVQIYTTTFDDLTLC